MNLEDLLCILYDMVEAVQFIVKSGGFRKWFVFGFSRARSLTLLEAIEKTITTENAQNQLISMCIYNENEILIEKRSQTRPFEKIVKGQEPSGAIMCR